MAADGLTYVRIDTFMTGLIVALAERGITAIYIGGEHKTSFHKAVHAAYEVFDEQCGVYGLELRFVIFLDELHGDSADIDEAMAAAKLRGLFTTDSPGNIIMRLKIHGAEDAAHYYPHLPGTPELYRAAAKVFVDSRAS